MTNKTKSFLLEIGVEDIPSNYLTNTFISDFKTIFIKLLKDCNVETEDCPVQEYITNRRLALKVDLLPAFSQSRTQQVFGPSVDAAYDKEGNPSRALQGFLNSKNADIKDLKKFPKGNKECVGVEVEIVGKPIEELLPAICEQLIATLKFPKSMRWEGADEAFVRPIRWILALIQDVEEKKAQTVLFEYAGLASSKTTYGHRIYTDNREIEITSINDYELLLEKSFVVVDYKKRYEKIRTEIEKLSNNKADIKTGLLESLTFLTEWPTVFMTAFDEEYLALPKEVLQESLAKNQKVFTVLNNNVLTNTFVGVVNSGKDNLDEVKQNYTNILHARLSDAKFFYHEDTKSSLESKRDKLKNVMFLKGLGSVYDRQQRMMQSAELLKQVLKLTDQEYKDLVRAASLCKIDLVSHMVYEFPEVQGVMGKYYAQKDGESEVVAKTIEQHYWPRFSGDSLPPTKVPSLLAILDKIDIIIGCFALGLLPTGNQDPYALRRAMRGIIQIILEQKFPIDILELYAHINALLPKNAKGDALKFSGFLKERIRLYFVQELNYEYDLVDAVLSVDTGVILDVYLRLESLKQLRDNALEQLTKACKVVERTANILKGAKDLAIPEEVNSQLFEHDLETQLLTILTRDSQKINAAIDSNNFQEATISFVDSFEETIHSFFEDVLVNVENQDVRKNRLSLMKQINKLYTDRIADLSKVVIVEVK